MSYAWNKLRLAVHCLTAVGPQRERLAAAIAEHVVCFRPKDLPSTWRPEFTTVIGRLGLELRPVRKQAVSIRRTVDALGDEEVSVMIHCILRLYDAVTRYQPIQTIGEVSE